MPPLFDAQYMPKPAYFGVLDPARVSRFEQEARAASALSHPNVCTIHALGETSEGQHYIAMEYVDGGPCGGASPPGG